MRRFLTLICLLCLAIPAGISVTGCTRNPAAQYCNGAGYGTKITAVATITLQPATTGISMAYGQTRLLGSPSAITCKGLPATVLAFTWGTTNNKLVDFSPGGNICAGTWNRNLGGGIADYTICSPPNPLPSTGGLPYATAYITASANSVSSNPVEVYVHPQVTSVSLVTTPLSGSGQKCFSQNSQATLDAQACYAGAGNKQYLLCAPASVTSSSSPTLSCPLPIINGNKVPLSSIPSCTAAIGTLNYSVGTSVASILTNTTTNQVTITANEPGTTSITASVSGSGSSAGYFSTCPPQSISVTLANGETSGTITKGVTQNLVTTVTDTQGNPITGLLLDYQSTDPTDISVSAGVITTAFPGAASVFAICQPTNCNSAPINEVGKFGTGLSLSSNPVKITVPGTASDYVWFSAPGQSQYFSSIQLLTGAAGSTVRLPYVPNSMIMDRLGNNLYFGSPHELMIVSTTSNTIAVQNSSVPGVVLAVSPNNAQVLINDQQQKLFYLYNVSSGSWTTFGGTGNAAAWTPDSKTLYITDNAALNNPAQGIAGHTDTLYVYSQNNWTTYDLPPSTLTNPLPPGLLPPTPGYSLPADSLPPNVAISSTEQTPAVIIPSVGAYLRGFPTVAHTWCPSGTVGDYASMVFYPQGPLGPPPDNSVDVQSDALVATTDGQHILGAAVSGGAVTLNDIGLSIPTADAPTGIATPLPCTVTTDPVTGAETLSALNTAPWLNASLTLDPSKVSATAINQIVASPESNLAFVTYTALVGNKKAQLPYYVPNSKANSNANQAPGTPGYLALTTQPGGTAPTAPLAGAFTPDDQLFFVSTAGDNMIHYICLSKSSCYPMPLLTDIQQISPNLPACTPISTGGNDFGCTYSGTGSVVPATAIAIKPRSAP